jgi:hypothetical protein
VEYLRDHVENNGDVMGASDKAKAELYSLGAVLAFWLNDDRLISDCLEGADRFGGTSLAAIIFRAVSRNRKPSWVAASA